MIRRRHVLLFAATLLPLVLAAGCGSGTPAGASNLPAAGKQRAGDVLATARSKGVLRVANTQANPPYSMIDKSNKVVGFDVDVANEIARRLGIKKVEFVPGTFQTFIPGLESDKWDAVIAGLTITDERKQQVDFSCPYQVNGVSIFVADRNTSISKEADLTGKRVAVSAGGTQEQQARKINGAKVLTYDNSTLALKDVATGRADAYIGSKFTGAYLAEQSGLALKSVAGYLSSELNGMAFPKGQEELKKAADRALADMISDGTLSKISRQWLGGLDVAAELKQQPAC
jgi:ABC-type amino acid transport substrate-binding protein